MGVRYKLPQRGLAEHRTAIHRHSLGGVTSHRRGIELYECILVVLMFTFHCILSLRFVTERRMYCVVSYRIIYCRVQRTVGDSAVQTSVSVTEVSALTVSVAWVTSSKTVLGHSASVSYQHSFHSHRLGFVSLISSVDFSLP